MNNLSRLGESVFIMHVRGEYASLSTQAVSEDDKRIILEASR